MLMTHIKYIYSRLQLDRLQLVQNAAARISEISCCQ